VNHVSKISRRVVENIILIEKDVLIVMPCEVQHLSVRVMREHVVGDVGAQLRGGARRRGREIHAALVPRDEAVLEDELAC